MLLAPRDPAALAKRAEAVATPGSPDFHQYLTPGQFAAQYGASRSTLERVERALRGEGLATVKVSRDRLALEVRTTAARAEAAFSTRLPRYRLASGAVIFANNTAPRIPASLESEVTGVLGLASLGVETPSGLEFGWPKLPRAPLVTSESTLRNESRPAPKAPVASTIGSSASLLRPEQVGPSPTSSCEETIGQAGAGLTAGQLASAYGFDGLYAAGDAGAGTTIALVEFAPLRSSDLATFAACYGLSPPAVTQVPVDGGPGDYNVTSQAEAELDVELLSSLAPAASLIVYEGPNDNGNVSNAANYDVLAAAVNADQAKVISTSWGGCEPSVGVGVARSESVLFEQAALQGQTFVAAAGDDGSTDCYGVLRGPAGSHLSVDDPASQPFVTGVGGTTLSLTPTISQTVWNTTLSSPEPGAGGGGVSSLWPMPAYQSSSAPSLDVVGPYARCLPNSSVGLDAQPGKTGAASAGNCREVPDVSANAGTPFATYCTIGSTSGSAAASLCSAAGWTPLGGTSAAAPIWAALFALTDSSPACATSGPVGFANPALYAIAGSPSYATSFTDITTGSNDLVGHNGSRYPATAGYNLAAGLGTPIAGSGTGPGLVAALCSPAAASSRFLGLALPSVTGLRPATARSRGGAHVVITGSNFTAARGVRFGGRPATTFRVASSSRIVAVVPPGAGEVHVRVIGPSGPSAYRPSNAFEYLTQPVVHSITPREGPGSGGTAVSLHGSYFRQVRVVRFGAVPTRFVVRSPDLLVAIAPPGTGSVEVTVTTLSGTSRSIGASRFHYSS